MLSVHVDRVYLLLTLGLPNFWGGLTGDAPVRASNSVRGPLGFSHILFLAFTSTASRERAWGRDSRLVPGDGGGWL